MGRDALSWSHAPGIADHQQWGQKAMFLQVRLALVPGGYFTFLCSTEHGHLSGFLWVILARCQLLMLYKGGPCAPHLREGKFQDSQSGSKGEPQGLLLVPCGRKHSTLSGLLWTLVIISHLTTPISMDNFKWAYKKQTLQSFLASLRQACRASEERQLPFNV